jgi:hypothetical protein
MRIVPPNMACKASTKSSLKIIKIETMAYLLEVEGSGNYTPHYGTAGKMAGKMDYSKKMAGPGGPPAN